MGHFEKLGFRAGEFWESIAFPFCLTIYFVLSAVVCVGVSMLLFGW